MCGMLSRLLVVHAALILGSNHRAHRYQKGCLGKHSKPESGGPGWRRALVFGLRCNQTGGARTSAHLQEGPTAKKKVPARGLGEAAWALTLPGCRVTTAGAVYTVVWPKGKVSAADRGEQQPDCFHSTSENSNRGDAECASCGCGFLVHSLTPY
ncbi:unnamed protein product [Pleuronectes platessa]|uniref:Secreted protein n=1 Tax=Pleuronectes platessa TaxID=8262 RepID=A0A9N7YI70_PLEPL|nr:unnamed protein product [Pleuronectes platessa]